MQISYIKVILDLIPHQRDGQKILLNFIYIKISSLADTIIVNSVEFKKDLKKFSINTTCILNPLNKEILKKSKIKVKKSLAKIN